ncbi:MAG: hypothetical protein MUP28_02650, partial [Candidatus Aminicenantes bacterium]|nr:hypothetical protein [Candidatus Aminicenantes bacterium]
CWATTPVASKRIVALIQTINAFFMFFLLFLYSPWRAARYLLFVNWLKSALTSLRGVGNTRSGRCINRDDHARIISLKIRLGQAGSKCDGFLAKTLIYIPSATICRQGKESSA